MTGKPNHRINNIRISMIMKQTQLPVSSCLILTAITSLLLSGAHARTWTNSDGTKTFEGELKSYDPRIGVVTVALSNGSSMHF